MLSQRHRLVLVETSHHSHPRTPLSDVTNYTNPTTLFPDPPAIISLPPIQTISSPLGQDVIKPNPSISGPIHSIPTSINPIILPNNTFPDSPTHSAQLTEPLHRSKPLLSQKRQATPFLNLSKRIRSTVLEVSTCIHTEFNRGNVQMMNKIAGLYDDIGGQMIQIQTEQISFQTAMMVGSTHGARDLVLEPTVEAQPAATPVMQFRRRFIHVKRAARSVNSWHPSYSKHQSEVENHSDIVMAKEAGLILPRPPPPTFK